MEDGRREVVMEKDRRREFWDLAALSVTGTMRTSGGVFPYINPSPRCLLNQQKMDMV